MADMYGGAEKKAKSKSISKSAVVSKLAEDNQLTKKQIEGVLSSLEKLAVSEVKKNGKFTIPGIVMVQTKHRAARASRPGRNPKTGETITIAAQPAKTVVRGRIVKAFKDNWK